MTIQWRAHEILSLASVANIPLIMGVAAEATTSIAPVFPVRLPAPRIVQPTRNWERIPPYLRPGSLK